MIVAPAQHLAHALSCPCDQGGLPGFGVIVVPAQHLAHAPYLHLLLWLTIPKSALFIHVLFLLFCDMM